MQTMSRLTLTALAIGIAGVMAAGSADASGFQIRENSVKNLGRANAGTTVAWGDASVVLNNPAAMVNLDRTTIQPDVTVIDLNASSEERRVGKECVSPCRSRWSPYHLKQKHF